MKNKIVYLLLWTCLFTCTFAQQNEFALEKGSACFFNHRLIIFGLQEQGGANFKLYYATADLKTTDSLSLKIKGTLDSYLDLSCDTLHGFLNIYLQQKETKKVTILRFNKKNELIASIEQVEIARLNNKSLFSNEVLYFKTAVYSVKTESDSSGKQFYINKYELKSETENFDYVFKWQFPFERKNVSSTHIFYANKHYVLLFVMVGDGPKTGQWILKLNAGTGQLMKATRLNEKTETNTYFFGNFFFEEAYKSICLTGQKFSKPQFDPGSQKINIANAPAVLLYTLELDSLGDVQNRQEYKVPVNDLQTGVKKTTGSYIVRISNFNKTPEGKMVLESDVFRSGNNNPCFYYVNSCFLTIVPSEDRWFIEKATIQQNKLIEEYYVSADKLDINGKLCRDSSNHFERIFHKEHTFRVKELFKLDAEKNPIWVLTKNNTRKNSIEYSMLAPVNKIYKVTNLETVAKSSNPVLMQTSPTSFVVGIQAEQRKYRLKLYNW